MSLARDIAELTGPRGALLVASTDLSHYHPQDEAVGLDAEVLRLVEQFDPEGLITAIQKGECEACGALPMATVMMAARELGATGAQVLRYATSGDVAGDRSAVVGYMAAAMYAEADGQGSPEEWPLLSPEAREELLRMARATLTNYLTDGTIPHFEASSDELRSHRGVFVTLTIGGRLRGCIGHHEPDTPLNRLVPEMAVAAGFRDPRFPPLTEAELPDVHIKVSSYLTPVYSIRSPDEYEVGVHGIILEKQGRASTFLPEVPVEQGWDRDTTLRHLCAKAGLPPDAWQEGCTFRVYKTQVFEEAR
jgi:AmmeMemoRadiSam system protein A